MNFLTRNIDGKEMLGRISHDYDIDSFHVCDIKTTNFDVGHETLRGAPAQAFTGKGCWIPHSERE
jgi:hypothetical protein